MSMNPLPCSLNNKPDNHSVDAKQMECTKASTGLLDSGTANQDSLLNNNNHHGHSLHLVRECSRNGDLVVSFPNNVGSSRLLEIQTSAFGKGHPRFPHPSTLLNSHVQNLNAVTQFVVTPKGSCPSRKSRHFVPNERKDEYYWQKRRKNNEAARKSREKRRTIDSVLEEKVLILSQENKLLKEELHSIKLKYGEISSSDDRTLVTTAANLTQNQPGIVSQTCPFHHCKLNTSKVGISSDSYNSHAVIDDMPSKNITAVPLLNHQQVVPNLSDSILNQSKCDNQVSVDVPAIDLSTKSRRSNTYSCDEFQLPKEESSKSFCTGVCKQPKPAGSQESYQDVLTNGFSIKKEPEQSRVDAKEISAQKSVSQNALPYKLRFKYAKSDVKPPNRDIDVEEAL
uniref:Nuclear factor interleukin-3-regulated protein-like n=1 Tax=Phallusia mammillata TaxID=59560 RepID=A0A6F9DMU0_9ASCI|nr:nuclear factor interleukin-3-regulated protein-like [Phallusia mammillata]